MTFSKEWNIRYKNNVHMSIWPWSDLVSSVMHFYKPSKTKIRVLELGCGAGANIPFFLSLNTEYFGMDGSEIIIKNLKKRFPKIKKNFVIGDFTKELPFAKTFDFVIDRSSITHNSSEGIKKCLDLVQKKLKKNGKLICIDWFSTRHFEYKNGHKTNDIFTKTDYKTGEFGGKLGNAGFVHFSNKKHLLNLFKNYKILTLDEKIIRKKNTNRNKTSASWKIIAQKN
jgi:SAM-dependent methyltransferase